jgi:hypothetical protein
MGRDERTGRTTETSTELPKLNPPTISKPSPSKPTAEEHVEEVFGTELALEAAIGRKRAAHI